MRPSAKDLKIETISETYQCLLEHQDSFRESLEILKRFREFEEYINKNKEERNKLESLMFQVKQLDSSEETLQYAKQEDVDLMKEEAASLDSWLYSAEGRSANYTTFMEKSANFSKNFEKIKKRKEEHAKRDVEVSSANDRIASIEKTISEMNETRPWVPKEEIEKSLKVIEEVKQWFNTSVDEQAQMALNEDPILTVKLIRRKVALAQEEVYRLRTILKDEPEKDSKYTRGKKGGDFKLRLRDLIGVFLCLLRPSS